MSLEEALTLISHSESGYLEFKAKGLSFSFPNPIRPPQEPGGEVTLWVDGFDNIDESMAEHSSVSIFSDIFHCSWPCYNSMAQVAINSYLRAGIVSLIEDFRNNWNFEQTLDFKKFLLQDVEQVERKFADFCGIDFAEYAKGRIYPTQLDDIQEIKLINDSWLYFVTADSDGSQQYVTFALAITSDQCLLISFRLEFLQKLNSIDEELHAFKQHLVEDYLRHIKVVRQ